ncbi:hypothetical protein K1T71_012252 [Dendrolimus kikuchii]|uniref:Uncharacterized protein n=1 Tax=Dendrolimus kikuchii TaxID=765133 RepID=A0ACC1CL14_9NEOP|nr:hypothetical protein K1T71_012252 [Dendrolimus kikuchii]
MLFLILAVLTSVQWTRQHLTYPINYCHLATTCIHDNRMVCATEPGGCKKRSFLDQCDMYEYNCDFGTQYAAGQCDSYWNTQKNLGCI